LGYQRLYVRRGGGEVLTLASFSPDGPLIAVMRRMVLESGVLPYEEITSAVVEKYGEPDRDLSDAGLLGWGAGAREQCYVMPYGTPNPSHMKALPGGSGEGALSYSNGKAWMIGIPEFPAELTQFYADCGEVMSYMREMPREWGHSGFNVVLIDFDAMAAAASALQPAETAEFEIEF
jgi:hypothetical protein